MRETAFRGKVYSGKWIYGLLEHCDDKNMSVVGIYDEEAKFLFEVNPETVGQYTGRKDKNGKMIFEGDIVKNGYSNTCGNFWDIGTVEYKSKDGCYCINNVGEEYPKRLTENQIKLRSIEIIGNIYDNPELMRGKV